MGWPESQEYSVGSWLKERVVPDEKYFDVSCSPKATYHPKIKALCSLSDEEDGDPQEHLPTDALCNIFKAHKATPKPPERLFTHILADSFERERAIGPYRNPRPPRVLVEELDGEKPVGVLPTPPTCCRDSPPPIFPSGTAG